MSKPTPPGLMTAEEAAECLGIGRSTAYRWLRRGDLPGRLIGSRWSIDREAFRVLLDGKPFGVPPASEPAPIPATAPPAGAVALLLGVRDLCDWLLGLAGEGGPSAGDPTGPRSAPNGRDG